MKSSLVLGSDDFNTAHVWNKCFGNGYGTVRILIILKNGCHGTPNRKAGTIQCMHELCPFDRRVLKADACTSCLKILAI